MTERLNYKSAGATRAPVINEAERAAAWDSCAEQIGTQSPFMMFWKVTNDILKSHDKPEMLYGEARDWWKQSGLQSL